MAQDAARQPKTWFITGCSSGFGEALVRRLRAEGDNVIATGRQADVRLAHLRDTGARVMDLDVSAPEAVIRAKVEEAWGVFPGGVDVVVNNAGYVLSALTEDLTQEKTEESFRTNFHGPMNITRAFLPFLRKKGTGTLLYLGSQAAWHADPSAGAYCASKAALSMAVECLSKELAFVAPGLKVLILEPGYFRTEVFVKITHPHPPPRATDAALTAFDEAVRAGESQIHGTEPGDPAKAVERMVELVRGTGMAEGREVPLRVPLGTDGLERIKGKCEGVLEVCKEWEDVARSTDW
ncbi:short-chain oxidoreductase [Colletotrichum karsti]|uniref:Short-chain oxidoreductase n=1 Tax=Colletotrichum karsti TaxID=1095194 RepID=A0A9P6IC17_9PEZI|nr:short-chain oxidoreductase [Colletotrichum karsti]KAF9875875.1 short-chain oxidoreductase [Colletotrichum karsti]